MHFIFIVVFALFIQGCQQQPNLCISEKELVAKSYGELTLVAKSIKEQEKSMNEFATFIDIMKNYVSDYSKTIEASAYLSNALRVLPIPYAGEVSTVAKLLSHSVVNLNDAATALHNYRQTSTIFLKKYDQLKEEPSSSAILDLSTYADNTLIIDALSLERNMEQISKTTQALVAAVHFVASTSSSAMQYLGKVESLFGGDEKTSLKDQDALVKSKNGFQANLVQLNKHIKTLQNSAMAHRQGIAKARVISDLAVEVRKRTH